MRQRHPTVGVGPIYASSLTRRQYWRRRRMRPRRNGAAATLAAGLVGTLCVLAAVVGVAPGIS